MAWHGKTQSFGTVPIDTQISRVDALIFSGYKWVTAGYGIAPVYVRKKVLEERGLPALAEALESVSKE